MTRSKKLRIAMLVVGIGIVIALVAGTALALSGIRRPFPTTDGEIAIAGLSGPVEVLRDDLGVPHIYADTAADLAMAQGYVHAQDRFFEMDLRRHITAGRLSELVGENEAALAADKVVRTLGWRRVAEAELPLLNPATRNYLQSYADGVNAWMVGPTQADAAQQVRAIEDLIARDVDVIVETLNGIKRTALPEDVA